MCLLRPISSVNQIPKLYQIYQKCFVLIFVLILNLKWLITINSFLSFIFYRKGINYIISMVSLIHLCYWLSFRPMLPYAN